MTVFVSESFVICFSSFKFLSLCKTEIPIKVKNNFFFFHFRSSWEVVPFIYLWWAYHKIFPISVIFKILFSSFQSLSSVQFFATPWIAACQASLSITNSWSSLRFSPIESVMPSSHLILCRPLLLLPPIPPSIRVFSNEPTLLMRWPKYWSFSFSIIPYKEIPGLISFKLICT